APRRRAPPHPTRGRCVRTPAFRALELPDRWRAPSADAVRDELGRAALEYDVVGCSVGTDPAAAQRPWRPLRPDLRSARKSAALASLPGRRAQFREGRNEQRALSRKGEE